MDLSRQPFLGVDLRISFLALACSVSRLRPCLDIHIRTTLAIRGVSYRHKCTATRKKSHEFHRMTHHFSKRKNASHIIFADWKCAMVRGFGADLIRQGANCPTRSVFGFYTLLRGRTNQGRPAISAD
jgi:hypothetical protein